MTVAYPRKLNNSVSARAILQRVVSDREIHLITLNRYRFNEQPKAGASRSQLAKNQAR